MIKLVMENNWQELLKENLEDITHDLTCEHGCVETSEIEGEDIIILENPDGEKILKTESETFFKIKDWMQFLFLVNKTIVDS